MTAADRLTLDAAAELIPGADRATLLRKARAGILRTYRVGKPYFTTRADVDAMIESCRVDRKAPGCGIAKIAEPGSSSTVHASAALDAALATVKAPRKL